MKTPAYVTAGLLAATVLVTGCAHPRDGSIPKPGTTVPTSPLWGDLQPGPYQPGFRVELIAGGTAENPRPLRTLVWHPSVWGSGQPMVYDDLLGPRAIAGLDDAAGSRYLAKDRSSAVRQFMGDDSEALLDRFRTTPLLSRGGSDFAVGPFPLVVHGLGRNGYQLENLLLWEYLASHGFVVAVVPQIAEGVYTRGLKFDAVDLQLQADDIVRTVDHMQMLPGVDPETLLYSGHSMGPVAALIAAQDRPPLALVSLDGAQASADGAIVAAEFPESLGAVPIILHLYNAENPNREASWMVPYDGWILEVGYHRATHFDFQMWPLFAEQTGAVDQRAAEVRSIERGAEIYRSSIKVTGCLFEKLVANEPLLDCAQALPEETSASAPRSKS